jgi:hypothetical protein
VICYANSKTARSHPLIIPPQLLALAGEVIELLFLLHCTLSAFGTKRTSRDVRV